MENFDYNTNKLYFITLCTTERRQILSDVVGDDAHIVPSKVGKLAEKYIKNVPEIEKYVIMPDHIHLIIRIEESEDSTKEDAGRCGHRPLQSNKVSSIIRSLKTLVTKGVGKPIFQRSFYDHIIRDEKDYREKWDYIDNNPKQWAEKRS